jgi:tetratricopeptide (TPR) repeat protein
MKILFLLVLFLGVSAAAARCQDDQRFEQFSPQEERMWLERLQQNPTNARAYFYLGRYYDFTYRYKEAETAFRQAANLQPGWAQAFYHLGKVYRKLHRYQEAKTALHRATVLKSDYAMAYHFLGLVNIDLGRYAEASKAFIKAYRLNPGWAEKYYDGTTFGIHSELGNKDVVLRLISHIYPSDQRLARIIYNRWARGNSGMQEY